MPSPQPRTRGPIVLGFIGIMSIVATFVLMLYVSTFGEGRDVLMNALVFLMAGLFMSFLTVGLRVEPFSMRQFSKTMLWTAVSFLSMYVVNVYAPFRLDVEFFNERYFAVLMGVAEELFFRVFLCAFIDRLLRNQWIAIGSSAGMWATYHVARYGADPSTMLIIFLCGCVLGASLLYSRQADGCILAHGGINYLATA